MQDDRYEDDSLLKELNETHSVVSAQFQSAEKHTEERMQPPPRQLWYMEQRPTWDGFLYWNAALLLEVLHRLEHTVMRTVVAELLKHHDTLRLRIRQDAHGYYHLFAPLDEYIPFSFIDLSAVPDEEQRQAIEDTAQKYQLGLNLIKGPTIFFVLFECGPEKPQRLLMVVSHTVCDAFSILLILKDFVTLYSQISQGQPPRLPSKTTSLKTLVEKKWEYSQSEAFQKELVYWKSLPWERICPLPLDFPEKKHLNVRGSVRNISASLTIEETALLVQELPKTLQANVLSILLTAFIKMLAQWTGSNFHAFFLVNNGRITPFPGVNLSRTVGNLILVPQIVLDVEGTAHLMEALEKIKTQLDRVPLYGMMWEWLPLNMTLKSELSFNYMGQQGRSEQVVSPWFRQAPESAGPVDDPQEEQWTLLGCTVIIIDKQLRVNLAYSENLFRQETIENLVSNYIEVLQHFIELTFRLPKFRPK